jgi:DNA-binding transcriptional LysR family regulator
MLAFLLLLPSSLIIGDVLDIRKLRMLAELERLGTIAAVSRELGQTAPGVSMQLAALEREVGLQLTERNGRNVVLTPAGRLLAGHGHDIVDRLSLAEGAAHALRDGAAGTYRIAAFPSIARTVVADAWRTIHEDAEDGIRLELVESEPCDSLPALAAGDVQIAVTHSYSNLTEGVPDDVEATHLGTEPVLLAIRSDDPLLAAAGVAPVAAPEGVEDGAASAPADAVDLRTLSGYDWIIPQRERPSGEMVHRACGLAGFVPRISAETNDFAVVMSLVAAGAGVALVPRLAAGALPDGVVLRPLVMPVYRHVLVLMRHAAEADPGARRVRDALVAAARRFLDEPIGVVPV